MILDTFYSWTCPSLEFPGSHFEFQFVTHSFEKKTYINIMVKFVWLSYILKSIFSTVNIMVKFVWLSYILKSIFSTVRMVQNQFDQIGCSGNPVQVRDLHVLQCVYIYNIYVYFRCETKVLQCYRFGSHNNSSPGSTGLIHPLQCT